MNKMDFIEENYYSTQTGYVIEGRRMTRERAVQMIVRNWYFTNKEAASYLDRLVGAFHARAAAVKGGVA